jgi:hypothetical protein
MIISFFYTECALNVPGVCAMTVPRLIVVLLNVPKLDVPILNVP